MWRIELFNGPVLTPLPPGATTIPTNQWTHVAITWGDQGTKLYVNGVQDAATPDNLYPALTSDILRLCALLGSIGLGLYG